MIIVTGLLLLLLSHQNQNFSIWYASSIYPILPQTVGWFFGLFPFSVHELLMVLLCLYLLWCCGYAIVNLCSSKGRAKLKSCMKILPIRLLYLLSILFPIFVLTTGINYNRESYADHIGITVRESQLMSLYKCICFWLNVQRCLQNRFKQMKMVISY